MTLRSMRTGPCPECSDDGTACVECCEHSDQDDHCCLICGKETLEDRMADAYDRAKGMKYDD